jgi:hypothetical protein
MSAPGHVPGALIRCQGSRVAWFAPFGVPSGPLGTGPLTHKMLGLSIWGRYM